MVNGSLIFLRIGWFSNVIVASVILASCDGDAGQVGGPKPPPPVIQQVGWLMHSDSTYGFAVRYPNDDVILKESTLPIPAQPPAVLRLRFQQKNIAAGQFADLEPPRFTIQVFTRSSGHSLRNWLHSVGLLPPGSEVSTVRLAGASEGLKVDILQQLAPNEFVYFATDKYVYRLIPFGPEGADMLASFRLIGRP